MAIALDDFMRRQLLDRRQRLQRAVRQADGSGRLRLLLEEVDSALTRIEDGSYGICEACHDSIECDRLIVDPLVRFCLDHLSRQEKSALEQDLQLAAQVQRGLLPCHDVGTGDWRISYHYEPAGLVSGDYCDVIDAGQAGLYFMVGDVSGKGVAASILMAHLHAMFRALIPAQLSLKCMLERASRMFSESTLPNQYATLVCGRALPDGEVEICNAGHPAPLMLRDREVWALEAANLPIGMFGNEEFSVEKLRFEPGQSLVIYSDGVSEARDALGLEYGLDRLRELLCKRPAQQSIPDPSTLVAACRDDLAVFRRNAPKTDDVTLFALGRQGQERGLASTVRRDDP
jgi:sigma-B regulation protein RsbU (phosphoserine phosphatase)